MSDPVTVYVELLDEAVDTWRPVQAEHVVDDRYRLTGVRPDGEVWPFAVGDIVRCKVQRLSGDWGRRAPVLVAYEAEIWKAALDGLVKCGGPAALAALRAAQVITTVEKREWIAEAVGQITENKPGS